MERGRGGWGLPDSQEAKGGAWGGGSSTLPASPKELRREGLGCDSPRGQGARRSLHQAPALLQQVGEEVRAKVTVAGLVTVSSSITVKHQ